MARTYAIQRSANWTVARQGRFAADLDTQARASELLALLDRLSTRVVLGQHGTDRDSALRMALSATARLVERK
ncbi:hypothetical protein [Streptomyces sp. NPDC059970]|uniref:hypothetical protein n=1 Tax=Streptomyces sp. NPDC059970 TaxID=3347019 RepID=UPI0036C3C4E0